MDEKKQKLYLNKDKLIETELASTKDTMSKMLDRLPNEELPFMEPYLRALYFETYFLVAKGFYNASLVLMGILLENIVKEKLFMENIKDEELEKINFGRAIIKIKPFISEDELKFLEDRKIRLRNPYAHYNKMKLSEGIYFKAWKIPSEGLLPKIIELDKMFREGKLTKTEVQKELTKGIKPEMLSSKELRPMAHIAKSEREKSQVVDVFLEVDKFVKKFAEKYFKPKNQ